jgi:hypothetical protein
MSALEVIETLRDRGQLDVADEVEELRDLLGWSRRKLHHHSFSKLEDAMAMDRLEHALGKYDVPEGKQ